MKKFIAAVIIAIAAIIVVAPLSMGLFLKNGLDSLIGKFNTKMDRIGGGSVPFELRLDSYEGGVLGAKSVILFAFDDVSIGANLSLVIESEFSYGWYFTGSFPFVSLVKSRDTVRLNDEMLASGGEELTRILDKGVLLEGETRLIPFVFINGRYTSKGVNFQEGRNQAIFEPMTIQLDTNFKNSLHLAFNLPLIEIAERNEKFRLEELSLKADGNIFDTVGNAESELVIKKIEVGPFLNVDHLLIKSSQKRQGSVVNALLEISADTLVGKSYSEDEKLIILTKPFISVTTNNIDAKTVVDLNDRLEDIYEQTAKNQGDQMALMMKIGEIVADMVSIFDKGAIIALKIELPIDGAPVSFSADLRGDPNVAVPEFRMEKDYFDELKAKLIEKVIINSELSVHQNALDLFSAPVTDLYELEMLQNQGYIERNGGVWRAKARFEKGQLSVGGKPLIDWPDQGSGYDDDYNEEYDFELDEEYD
ncbi:MAG: YdgA family protein [Helicobacteraceae bacterium]|jgi:hypothetical protein|nr:YdgA family protein [Helicobacteraceae bacterium]